MRDYYEAYKDNRYSALYEPMRRVMGAMGKAMWMFAAIKEITWYQWGMEGLTAFLHHLEHVYPEYIDEFKALLAQLGLPLVSPPLPELTEAVPNAQRALELSLDLVDEVNEALSGFIEVTDTMRYEPLARKAENIQMANFEPRAILTQALTMAEQGASEASYDSWIKNTLKAPQKE